MGIRIDRGTAIHIEAIDDDAVTLCGRGGSVIKPTTDVPTCKTCQKVDAARVRVNATRDVSPVRDMPPVQVTSKGKRKRSATRCAKWRKNR